MTTAERNRNLERARAASIAARRRRRDERAERHAVNAPAYKEACRAYYAALAAYGEGSGQVREAWRAMMDAEVAWIDSYPKGGAA